MSTQLRYLLPYRYLTIRDTRLDTLAFQNVHAAVSELVLVLVWYLRKRDFYQDAVLTLIIT